LERNLFTGWVEKPKYEENIRILGAGGDKKLGRERPGDLDVSVEGICVECHSIPKGFELQRAR